MELRHPVSLQHMLEEKKKNTLKNSLFSGLADWPRDDLHEMPAMHKHSDKQKRLQCIYCRRSRVLRHNMGKILAADIHTQHTAVCMHAWLARPDKCDGLAADDNNDLKTCLGSSSEMFPRCVVEEHENMDRFY